ncbi:MAG: ankyrin repeat domain-containing protein, partial [Proteobacteria bacterium]|nr:ankyrin repeat domain-containing protein [Pseudomonadota bacterium]
MNALMLATDKNDTECVKLLLAHGATTNTQTRSLSPLMLTAINSNAQCMRMLLEHGSNPNIQDKNGNTALMMAARAKDVECLQLLINKGANLNTKDNDNFHALMIAQCCENNNACISLLIRAGSSLNLVNTYNETPLNYAIDSDNEVIFEHLIKFGADVNQETGDACTPLWCVINSYEQIQSPESYITALLRNGANPNLGRYPPLTLAAQSSYISCMQILLKGGASIDAVDPEFGTVLSIAGYMGSTRMIRIAWNYQAKINISPKEPDLYPRICDDEALIMLFATGQNWSFFESGHPDIPKYLTESRNEKSLKNYCREAIRKYIKTGRNVDLFRQIPLLKLPQLINSYLLYGVKMH